MPPRGPWLIPAALKSGVFVLAVGLLAGLWGCSDSDRSSSPGPLRCHVGGTMWPVMKHLARIYEAETGQAVEINSAGSGELLAYIELQTEGDLYVCHDPFLDILMKKFKMGVDGWVLAELTPVIVVQKGNPKNIASLGDLTRPDVEVALTDYERSTLGRMLKTIFGKAGIDLDQLNKDKKIATNKSGGHVANLVTTGNADAAMCWRAVARLRLDDLDVVPIPEEHLPTPGVDAVTSATGNAYPLTPVRVTVATLTCAAQPEAAGKFAEFVASDRAGKVLKSFGFTIIAPGKMYENGQAID